MSSQLDVRLGVQTPQIVHQPPDVVSLDAAMVAIELADAYGICDGHPLDESQKVTLRSTMGERADRTWAAATVGHFGPRQTTGKNDTVAARELAGLLVFGERLQIHTAHEFPTANEAFLRMVAVFEAWDDLSRKVARIRYANGEQGIELLSGQRLKYRARTGGSGRGFAKANLVVYDEAQHLQAEHVAASGPARLANPNSQGWYMGSGGLSTSVNAWRMRRRALAGNGGRFAYVEHTAERVSLDADGRLVSMRPDVLDRDAWALANPAYGWRISDESLMSLYEELGPELFARECLCMWDPEPGEEAGGVIDTPSWSALKDPASRIDTHWQFALDVSSIRHSAAFGMAGRRADGLAHVETFDHRPGTGWVLDRGVEIWEKRSTPIRIGGSSPAAAFIPLFRERGVEVVEVLTSEHAAACGQLIDAALNGRLRHLGQLSLDTALRGAVLRPSGDAELWARRSSKVDITPLVAVTLALGGVPAVDAKPDGTFLDLDDYLDDLED
jgi:hypothetical protein